MKTNSTDEQSLLQEIGSLKKRIAELEKVEKQSGDTVESIFRVAPAGMGMLQNRVFIETNPLMCQITGYSREELVGQSSRILYRSDKDYARVGQEKYKQIEEFGTGTVETTWKRKDGKLLTILLSSTPVDRKNLQKGVIFTALDITEQKKTQKAIESSEERLSIIFENAPDAIYLSDLKGNFVEGNKAAEKLIGQTKDELIGQNFLKLKMLGNQDILKATRLLAQNVLGKKTGPDNFLLHKKNGEKTHTEISTYPVTINKKRLVLGIARDMNERIKAEAFKRESEQRMAFHVNQTPLAVIEWDLNFKVKNWNPAAEKIFGYTKEEALGKHASFIIPENDMHHVDQIWMEVTMMQGSGRGTNTNKNKNGEMLICDWYNTPLVNNEGEVIAVASLALDVTTRVRSEQIQKVVYNISNAANTTDNLNRLISTIQNELSSIIDTTNFFIALYDKEKDLLSLPFFADEKDKFSYFPAGKTLTAYVIRTAKPLLATRDVMRKLERSGEIETVGSNSEIWLGVPLELEKEVIGVLAVQSYKDPNAYNEADMKMLQFVSDQVSLSIHRKNAEVKMIGALEKAKESDRLKSAFLANMSHEIRTPMNGILGFANLLKNEELSTRDRKNYISIIEKSGKRMLGIINDLIDISKIESGMTEITSSDFNLNHSMEYVYSFFKPEAEAKGLALSFSCGLSNDNALIHSDREKIYAILINLVKNAIKYTKEGGIEFAYVLEENTLRFKVQDTGIGIPGEKLESIFNRFVQADQSFSSSYEGVGLGLAITKAYVQLLDGKIWVKSEFEQGSVFHVEIPYTKGETAEQIRETEKTEMEATPTNKLKILVAEDDVINRKLFSYLLKDISSELIITTDGSEAIETYSNTPGIDLILMDLKMPKMDGYEATQFIRKNNSEIKIIALSAFALETERKKAMECGFNDYVSKPISKTELFKTIAKYFEL